MEGTPSRRRLGKEIIKKVKQTEDKTWHLLVSEIKFKPARVGYGTEWIATRGMPATAVEVLDGMA